VYACHFLYMYFPDRGCVQTLLTLYVYATAADGAVAAWLSCVWLMMHDGALCERKDAASRYFTMLLLLLLLPLYFRLINYRQTDVRHLADTFGCSIANS